MRTAIYTRVSTDMQVEEGFSLDAQLERLTAFCKSQDWMIADIYTDEGLSAKNTERPQLQRMLSDIESGKIDVVLAYKLDRLTRSVKDLQELLDLFEKYRVGFKSMTEVFDTTTASGRLFMTLVAAMAQWERENLGERVAMGVAQKAKTGRSVASLAPYGYNLVDGNLVVNDSQAMIVREMFERYSKGESSRDILFWLNNSNTPSPSGRIGAWTQYVVSYILKNATYKGVIEYGRHARSKAKVEHFTVDAVHDAIVSAELWDTVQNVRLTRKHFGPRAATGKHHPLVGVIRCGLCGHVVVGKGNIRKNIRPYYGYSCNGKSSYRCCDAPNQKAETVEAAVLDELERIAKESLEAKSRVQPEEDHTEKERLALRRELKSVEERRNKWKDAFEQGFLGIEDVKDRLDSLKREELAIQTRINGLSAKKDATNALDFIFSLRKVWEHATTPERKELIRTVVERIDLFPNAEVKVTLRTF